MGMDFEVIAIQKSEIAEGKTAKDLIENWDYEDYEKHELAYGRKCWELVYELRCDTQHDCISPLEMKNWIDLQEKLAPIGPSLEAISLAFQSEYKEYDTPHEKYLRQQYMKWYDACFDADPTLGYDFSVGYMREFWEAADKVLKYLEDPDWEVWMSASYQKGY